MLLWNKNILQKDKVFFFILFFFFFFLNFYSSEAEAKFAESQKKIGELSEKIAAMEELLKASSVLKKKFRFSKTFERLPSKTRSTQKSFVRLQRLLKKKPLQKWRRFVNVSMKQFKTDG